MCKTIGRISEGNKNANGNFMILFISWEMKGVVVWKELLKLTSEDVSLRSSRICVANPFHTEERLKCGVLPIDGLCRHEAVWELV